MVKKKKLDQLQNDLSAVEKEIQTLSTFRKTLQRQKYLRQLQGERSHIKRQIQLAAMSNQQKERERAERFAKAQHNRSEKNKRNWRYAKAIADNYGIPIKKVRSELKKRKKGLESDIQDVIWRNPSP